MFCVIASTFPDAVSELAATADPGLVLYLKPFWIDSVLRCARNDEATARADRG